MAQTNYTPISLYYSTTASAVPTAANLVQGELAINTNDGKLYYEDSAGVVRVLASKSTGSIGGSNTQVQFNSSGSLGGSAGLTYDGAILTISSGASASALTATSTSAGGTALNIQNSGTVNALIGGYLSCIGSGSASDVAVAAYQGALAFATNGANERARIDSTGNLLVGTTNTTKTNTGFRVESGVANTSRGSTGSFFEFYDTGSGSRIGFISNSGGVATLYNTTSDQRLKTNIVDAPSGNIDSIKVRSFDWVGNGSHQPYGMVAQELIEVAPYAVNKPENPDEMMAVDYSKLVPMMIKEIQDLKQRIASLENK